MSLFTTMTSMAQLVTPPEGLQTETYEMYSRDIIFGAVNLSNVQIGFDGEVFNLLASVNVIFRIK